MIKKVIVIVFVLIFLLSTYVYYIEPRLLQVKETEINSADIPKSFDGIKAVFISDIHHGPFLSIERVNKLVGKVNGLTPDIILLGGDYSHWEGKYIRPCFDELKNLKAPLGVYGVMGNHDHWHGWNQTIESMKDAGITLLDNDSKWITKSGDKIKIGGAADYTADIPDFTQTKKDIKSEDFVILLAHNPDTVEEINFPGIDLVLSGHTHGGQVTLFGLWGPIIPSKYGNKYRSGLVTTPFTKVLVSNGVGTITPPVRFCAPPEVNLIKFKKSA